LWVSNEVGDPSQQGNVLAAALEVIGRPYITEQVSGVLG
jgi:hypothetical protein